MTFGEFFVLGLAVIVMAVAVVSGFRRRSWCYAVGVVGAGAAGSLIGYAAGWLVSILLSLIVVRLPNAWVPAVAPVDVLLFFIWVQLGCAFLGMAAGCWWGVRRSDRGRRQAVPIQ